MLVEYFVYIAHVEAYFLWMKILAHGNIRRRKRTLGNEKRGKKRPKKRERIPFCRNRKILDESNWYSTPPWRPDEVAI